jgi:hypothetical protein
MAMKLPTYNQPGWGATLNNYLRELNQRISKVEASSGGSSNGVGQVFGASAFSTGLTSVAGTCLYDEVEKYSTFQLGSSGLSKLSFTGEYFISQSTVEGNAFLGKLDNAEWGSNIANLASNQVMLICADEDRTLHIIPFTQAKNNRELDYNLCRLGYLTKIDGSHIYFTPCPNLATMDLHDKYNYIMRPTYKSNDGEQPQITVGSYSYMMEGLNYYKHFKDKSKTNTTPLQVLDGELYNIHTFENVVTYFLIQKNETTEKEEVVREYNSEDLEKYIQRSENKIFIFYVTIAGIVFVREISLKEDEQIVDSTSLANFLVDTKFEESNALFYYYSWLKPLELKRCGKDPFGNLRWHMASYNGISPQIVGTPIHAIDTNYYWADNYLLQIKNSDESARHYYGLRIRPYVQLDMNHDEGEYDDRIPNEEKTNAYVVLNVSDQSTPTVDSTKPGIFLYNYPFAEDLHFGGYQSSDSVFSITKNSATEKYYQLSFNKPIRKYLKILDQTDDNRYVEISSTGSAPRIKFQSSDGGYNSLFNSFSASLKYGNRNIISLNSNPSNDDSSFFSISNSVSSTLFRVSKNESIINSLETKIIGKNSVLISDTDAAPYLFNLTREKGLILDTYCSAVDFTVTSDIHYKNLHSNFIDSGLNIINQLPIYNYSFKTTPDKETIGITAQDLLKVLPQLVDISDDSHYKINESKLVYVCMQAIKELNEQIKILKQEVNNLRGN